MRTLVRALAVAIAATSLSVVAPAAMAGSPAAWALSNWFGGVGDVTCSYGESTDVPLAGDWDANGADSPGVFRDGRWYLSDWCGGSGDHNPWFGGPGDIPITGRWSSGTAGDSIGVYRNTGGASSWTLLPQLAGGTPITFLFGNPGDIPVVGDWDGDGVDSVGVYRAGWWYLTSGPAPDVTITKAFPYGGVPGDRPVVGDWDGDGIDTVGVFRGDHWILSNSFGGGGDMDFAYGVPTSKPVPGDWDGNSIDTPGVMGAAYTPGPSNTLKVATYNLRAHFGEPEARWNGRWAGIKANIDSIAPDLLALNELEGDDSRIADSYRSIRAAYVDGDKRYDMAGGPDGHALLWDQNRFTALSFQSSDIPTQSATCNDNPRSALGVQLYDRQTNLQYYVLVAHLSPTGGCASIRSAQVDVLRTMLSNRPGGTPLVLGDLNAETPKCSDAVLGAPIAKLDQPGTGYDLTPAGGMNLACASENATINSNWDDSAANDTKRIDYVFHQMTYLAGGRIPKKYTYFWSNAVGNVTRSPSDHYPVWANLCPATPCS
jgi:endonuclease/exonuclease/phosphatase family metal-dependent hydrolase